MYTYVELRNLPEVHSRQTVLGIPAAVDTMDPAFFERLWFSLLICTFYHILNILSHKAQEVLLSPAVTDLNRKNKALLEKKNRQSHRCSLLNVIHTCNPLARITSTSRHPFWWHIDSWMSPKEDAPSTWRPTNCPGPKPSIKSEYCPTSAPLSDGDHLI